MIDIKNPTLPETLDEAFAAAPDALRLIPRCVQVYINAAGLSTLPAARLRCLPGADAVFRYCALSTPEQIGSGPQQALELANYAHAAGCAQRDSGAAIVGIGTCTAGGELYVCTRYGDAGLQLCAANLTCDLNDPDGTDVLLMSLFILNEILNASGCERMHTGLLQDAALQINLKRLVPPGLALHPDNTGDIVQGAETYPHGIALTAAGHRMPAFSEMPADCTVCAGDEQITDCKTCGGTRMIVKKALCSHDRNYVLPIRAPLSETDYLIKHLLDQMTGRKGVYRCSTRSASGKRLAAVVRSTFGRGDLIVHIGDPLLYQTEIDDGVQPCDIALTFDDYVQAVAERGMRLHNVLQATGVRVYVLIKPGAPLKDLMLPEQRGTVIPVMMPYLK